MRFLQSLYLRLVLVLLLALGASYGTMYVLFERHLEDTRDTHFARSVAAQVRLVEELLRSRPAADLAGLKGLRLATEPPPMPGDALAGGPRLVQLQKHLAEELGHDIVVVPDDTGGPGMWLELRAATAPTWMFVAARKPRPHALDPLGWALLAGFGVFLGGGMLLLWQLQRPLKRLGQALVAIGRSPEPGRLPVSGAGEVRILGERYNEMVERLQHYEEDRATMLAGVAHDLRSPITRMRLLAELDQGARSAELLKNLADIERITEQFLVYARAESDEAARDWNLGAFVAEVAAPFAGRGVAVAAVDGEIVAPIRADALRRALINLIENAVEYGRPPIVLSSSRRGEVVTIAVADAGAGIDPEQVGRALRPFARLDRSRGGKGHCGLGLVIAQRIAALHGGRLELRRREGGGFSAEIRLPARAATASA